MATDPVRERERKEGKRQGIVKQKEKRGKRKRRMESKKAKNEPVPRENKDEKKFRGGWVEKGEEAIAC
jgi:hypothetical protein